MLKRALLATAAALFLSVAARADLPPAATDFTDFPMAWTPDAPGDVDASFLLPKPAGALGSVTVRDGHFFTGDKRLRLWGVNFAFSACFPTHEQADGVARRLSRYGINAVRLHHMDAQKFPNGIWADEKGELMSPEALERLDYLVAALKREGVYVDLNLHVSRNWSKAHGWENADKLPESYDKMLDVFHPDLIAANAQYARDLLGHVNAYTKTAYAQEPAVAVVEINNEDTLFLWGGEAALAKLPEPYAGLLKHQWNGWLAKKYASRDALKSAWAEGEQPLGPNLLSVDLKKANVEQHGDAKASAAAGTLADGAPAAKIDVTKTDGTDWHAQWTVAPARLTKGTFYTVSFVAKAEKPTTVTVSVSQTKSPWGNLGLAAPVKLDTNEREYAFGFAAANDDDAARIAFAIGHDVDQIALGRLQVREGGRLGLRDEEDATKATVASHAPGRSDTRQRTADWFDFLQQTDEAYFVSQLHFLKDQVGVRCPITGSIGLGPLGTLSQSKMDFVDAHAYWDHPTFPHRQWDMKDWLIKNTPMVDKPEGATLWQLAATRVAGKPFTVTEYNHAAPNEWEAECVPFIAAYAALQDWDGVFLFAYAHGHPYDKQKTASFFDIEGNPLKMPLMPLAARLFLGGAVQPLPPLTVHPKRAPMLETGSRYYYTVWPFVRDVLAVKWQDAMEKRLALSFDGAEANAAAGGPAPRWTVNGPGTGQFSLDAPNAAVRVGFFGGTSTKLGPVTIKQIDSPFTVFLLVAADPRQSLESADRLLLAAVGRARNTDMQWDAGHHTVADHWGRTPTQIETVRAMIDVGPSRELIPLNAEGAPTTALPSGDANLAGAKTLWFEIRRTGK